MTADALTQLRDALVNAFPDPPEARELAERAGFAEGSLPIDQHDMRGWWWASLHEAWRQGILVALVERAIADEVIGPELKQPFIELREPIAQLQARPAPRPRGVRIALAAAAGLLIVAAIGLGIVWLRAPAVMDGAFNVAVAEFGHLSPDGAVESSDLEQRVSRLIYTRFAQKPPSPSEEVPPLVWHDSMPWWAKRATLGVVAGTTDAEQANAARVLKNDIGAHLVIYGGEVTSGDDVWLALHFYAPGLVEGAEMIGEDQLGQPLRVLRPTNPDPAIIEELNARAEVYYHFALALSSLTNEHYAAALTHLERAANVSGWEDRKGKAIVTYFMGRTRLDLKDYPGAIADFDEAIRLDPNYARPYLGQGMAYLRQAEALSAGQTEALSAEQADQKLMLLQQALDAYGTGTDRALKSSNHAIEARALHDRATTYRVQAGVFRDRLDLTGASNSLDRADEEAGRTLALANDEIGSDDLRQQLTGLAYYDLATNSHARAFLWCQSGDRIQAIDHYEIAFDAFQLCDEVGRSVTDDAKSIFTEDLINDCARRAECTARCLDGLQGGHDVCSTDECKNVCSGAD